MLHFLLSFVYTKPFTIASVFYTMTLDSRPLEPNVFPLHSRTLDMDNVAVERHAKNELIHKYTILQHDPNTITNCLCTMVTICVLKEINYVDEFRGQRVFNHSWWSCGTQAASTAVWDLLVIGWDVSYEVEFAPTATKSHHTTPKKTKNFFISGTYNQGNFRLSGVRKTSTFY